MYFCIQFASPPQPPFLNLTLLSLPPYLPASISLPLPPLPLPLSPFSVYSIIMDQASGAGATLELGEGQLQTTEHEACTLSWDIVD